MERNEIADFLINNGEEVEFDENNQFYLEDYLDALYFLRYEFNDYEIRNIVLELDQNNADTDIIVQFIKYLYDEQGDVSVGLENVYNVYVDNDKTKMFDVTNELMLELGENDDFVEELYNTITDIYGEDKCKEYLGIEFFEEIKKIAEGE